MARARVSFGIAGLLAVVPAALVFIEPDLGTALIFRGDLARHHHGRPGRAGFYLLLCLAAIVPVIYFAWYGGFGHKPIFQAYQKDRINLFPCTRRPDEFDFCSNVVQGPGSRSGRPA